MRHRYPLGVPLDLLLPDLLHPGSTLRMPALERWLARGDAGSIPEGDLLRVVARAYGMEEPLPVAAVALAGGGFAATGTWLCADPVHLEVMQDAVALRDGTMLNVTREEADALLADLERHFASDDFHFMAPAPHRWFVNVPAGEAPTTVPLPDAEGRNLFGLLPRGTGRVNWPSALTEVQMLFAGHPVNQAREARGDLAINAVWFWGEGELPSKVAKPYAAVYSDATFVRGLGTLSDARVLPVPESWAKVDAVRRDESVLVVLDGPSRAWRRNDVDTWRAEAARLDETWLVPLRDAVERFETVTLTLPRRRDALVVRVEPRARWRFFRGVRPLAAHA